MKVNDSLSWDLWYLIISEIQEQIYFSWKPISGFWDNSVNLDNRSQFLSTIQTFLWNFYVHSEKQSQNLFSHYASIRSGYITLLFIQHDTRQQPALVGLDTPDQRGQSFQASTTKCTPHIKNRASLRPRSESHRPLVHSLSSSTRLPVSPPCPGHDDTKGPSIKNTFCRFLYPAQSHWLPSVLVLFVAANQGSFLMKSGGGWSCSRGPWQQLTGSLASRGNAVPMTIHIWLYDSVVESFVFNI